MKKTMLILAVAFLSFTTVFAQKPEVVTNNKPGWHKIGETTVDFKTDKDQILVLGADKFKKIQLKVKDAPIHMEDLQVFYENDTKEDVTVRSDFRAGSESRVIDLKGADRRLKKVEFVYRTVPNTKKDKAQVELWGLK